MEETNNLGVDLDGVVANYAFTFSQLLRELYGKTLPLVNEDDFGLDWDWAKWYPLTKEQIDGAYLEEMPKVENFWMKLKLMDEADWTYFKDQVQSLKKTNVYFITSRISTEGYSVVKQSQKWLIEKGFENPNVIVHNYKGPVVKALNIKAFIDDKFGNCADVLNNNGSNCEVYLRNCNYNLSYNHPKIKRVNSLKEFIDSIKPKLKLS
jgi:uncharacterized HAD superfamily protein